MNSGMRGTVKATVLIVGAALVAAFLLEGVTPTQAMPPFAQSYGINCEVCHASVPALNAYGRYVQRTGYASLDANVMHGVNPIWVSEAIVTDTQGNMPGRIQTGNLSLHGAGFLGSDVTFHFHQWIVQNNMPGGTDTMWLTFNNLLHRDAHLTAGKLELPAPSPFSQWFELSGFNPPAMTVGEHAYGLSGNRWGGKLQYIRNGYIVEGAFVGPNGDLNSAFDFTTPTDKTFQYRAAYARPDKPFEAGFYGATGSWPLSDGTFDHYNVIAPYVEIDAQGNWPGLFALYQTNHDANAGPGFGPASSSGYTVDLFKPFMDNKIMVGTRYEMTNDGLGTLTHYGYVDLGVMLSRRVSSSNANALMLNGEVNMTTGSTPGWRAMLVWNTSIGNVKPLSR